MSTSTSIARLTSTSTQTLTLLLERERLSLLSPQSSPSPPSSQISRKLTQLYDGVRSLEQTTLNDVERRDIEELRDQYEKMRGMLGEFSEGVPSLISVAPEEEYHDDADELKLHSQPVVSNADHTIYQPYRDEPDPEAQEETSNEAIFEAQRQLMDHQDTQLDNLSHSINRQHSISLQINSELDTHHTLLESLDQELDQTGSRLDGARRGLDRFARGVRGNGGTWAIGLIIFVLLILIVVFKT
ncbi:hypothetical protein SISSUDRAFT_1127729 [Sistotremastrum suecicum HHB10207 ss-3]|uniref:t-SNARE coiled-coil homology domain-containing protein n=1 Tax=Sistotremastrum suecicum HHB10207 ss-3 TaxID=1314776 RepID=A0A166ESA3_9AGAM|nr:hypothetical protein SISSUDRAFT_1127729 [Sistotremastrum suecicum HHB10207 ss-3]